MRMKLQIALIGIAAILLSGCGNIKSVARYTPPTNQSGVKTGDTAKTQPPDLPSRVPTNPPPTPTYTPPSSPSPGFNYKAAYPLPEGWSRITGTVLPQHGGQVVGAMVRFVEPSGKTALTISCQAGGHFTTPNLPTKSHNPSVYQLVATAPGYGTFIMQSVPLFDRQIVTVALPLPPAGQTVTGPGFSLLPGPGSGLGALMPVVAGIFPASGPVTGGTRVILTGTNFFRGGRGQLPTVDFGTHAATSVTLLSANRIQATSPAGSGTVNVTVTTMIGTSVTGSADRFTYVGEPIP